MRPMWTHMAANASLPKTPQTRPVPNPPPASSGTTALPVFDVTANDHLASTSSTPAANIFDATEGFKNYGQTIYCMTS